MSIVAKRKLIPGRLKNQCYICDFFTLYDTDRNRFFETAERRDHYSDFDIMILAETILRYTDKKTFEKYLHAVSEEEQLGTIMMMIANRCTQQNYEVEEDEH